MKILFINKNFIQNNNDTNITFDIKEDLEVSVKADSTLLKNGKPFFIPTYTNRCIIQYGLIVRISRLGKTISERFAHRYYDAITVGVSFTPIDLKEKLQKRNKPIDLCMNIDSSMAIGNFIALNEGICNKPLENCIYGISILDKTFCTAIKDMTHHIDEIIAFISNYMSFRQGDLLFIASKDSMQAEIDQHISGFLDNEKILDFNIK